MLVTVSADWSLHSHANDLLLERLETRATLLAHDLRPVDLSHAALQDALAPSAG